MACRLAGLSLEGLNYAAFFIDEWYNKENIK
jgi:hypothetical protein